ncbi:uncharacterized protein LOC143848493 [Tasmannia lanceolata]|uniref:uncharacterized protein LOC143848493 n=1 Tax=Tasmannia lanceolata TaxID=3420 RepID=UPI0040648669
MHLINMERTRVPSQHLKKVASCQEFSTVDYPPRDSSSSSSEDEKEEQKIEKFDMWSSILSKKDPDSKTHSSYIHPLVKRSSSSLSKKSLEICTENLGSETGSEGFSSSPDDLDHSSSEIDEQVVERVEKYGNNYHGSIIKKSPPRSFPPPLPSLSLHMKRHREEGHLVLEAVPVRAHKIFHAQRHEGRLVLTFAEKEEKEEERGGIVLPQEVKVAVDRGIVLPQFMGGLILMNRNRNRNPYLEVEKEKVEENVVGPRRVGPTSAKLLSNVNAYEGYRKVVFSKKEWSKRENDVGPLVPVRRCNEPRRTRFGRSLFVFPLHNLIITPPTS